MQATAVPFVLYELTDSNAWVGAAAFAALAFSVFVSPVAGILIDRFSQKAVLMAGQVVQLVPAFVLAGLAAADALSPWPMLVLIAIGGMGSGLQFPAAQSFVPTIVATQRVPRGVRMVTLGLTVSRTVGPAVAGHPAHGHRRDHAVRTQRVDLRRLPGAAAGSSTHGGRPDTRPRGAGCASTAARPPTCGPGPASSRSS